MSNQDEPNSDHREGRLEFRFSRASNERTVVPATVLIQTLSAAQRAIWLIALSKEHREVRSRARIPADIEQRYQLKCEVPQPGSYVLPAFLESAQTTFLPPSQIASVLSDFEGIADSLKRGNRESVAEFLPDTAIRRRVVDAFEQLGPKPGSGWLLDISQNGANVSLDGGWQSAIRRMYSEATTEPDIETVNCELIRIDFANRRLTIVPLGSGRQKSIEVTYDDDQEDFLLENRKGIIQITGRTIRDENDELKSIFSLEDISSLDLSPLILTDVVYENARLKFLLPRQIEPELSEDKHYVCVQDATLGLDVFAGTISSLVDEVNEAIVMTWKAYALAADSELSPKAVALKYRLLETLEEVR